MKSHKLELENLSILNHLENFNILELLALYIYDKKHHLIFLLAEESTLNNLLESESESNPFKSNKIFYIAFAGLFSRIKHLHNFVEKKINLSLIGYHHNLRPKNILVSRNIFVLADFSLSRFKDSFESSKMYFQKEKDDYLALECKNLLENFKRQDIHWSSNIWLFDCILSKVATYISRGLSAIQMFREKRKLKIYNFIITYFHCGLNQWNQIMDDWLIQLEGMASKSFKMLLGLIWHMLHLNKAKKPKADVVMVRLQFIVVYEIVESMDKLFAKIFSRNKSFDAFLKKERFAGWKYTLDLLNSNDTLESLSFFDKELSSSFESILENLFWIKNHLNSILGQNHSDQHLNILPLRHLNNQLNDILNLKRQNMARSFFKLTMVKSNIDSFFNLIKESVNFPLDREIKMRATLTQMTKLVAKHSQMHESQRLLNTKAVEIGKTFSKNNIGLFSNNGIVRQVLMKWRKQTKLLMNETVNQKLFSWVNAIANVLN